MADFIRYPIVTLRKHTPFVFKKGGTDYIFDRCELVANGEYLCFYRGNNAITKKFKSNKMVGVFIN